MVLPNIMAQHMGFSPQYPMPSYLCPPNMQMMQHMMNNQARPNFPGSTAATTGSMASTKATFPAYSNATISAPPTTNTSNNVATSDQNKATLIPATSTTSRIVHPAEDISLEELRARKACYQKKKITYTPQPTFSSSSQYSTNTPYSTSSNMGTASTTTAVSMKHHEPRLMTPHEVRGIIFLLS